MTDIDQKPAWSYVIPVMDIPAAGLDVEFSASPAECEALRALGELNALSAAQARFHLTRKGKDGLRAIGEVSAAGEQTCVVSLEPVAFKLKEPLDVAFLPQEEIERRKPSVENGALHDAHELSALSIEEEPEAIVNGRVDLGALASEFLILGLDPYPRKPGAVFNEEVFAPQTVSPFEALRGFDSKKTR